jgi:fructose-1,6-bisphosphatase III
METTDLKYLRSLSKLYPSTASAATEIINLSAILSLPKGTEHFMTDIHGEYEQFTHILRNGSGAIRRKIDDQFKDKLTEKEKKELATLIYYPKLKLENVVKKNANMDEWYRLMICHLIIIAKYSSSKYTKSKVRKALPKEFAYVIEELLSNRSLMQDQEGYYEQIVESVIQTGKAKELIVAMCDLIRRLVVDHLHIIGDIFDRGPSPHLIMDDLMAHHSIDIQWGNHDVLWMGAAVGQTSCMATILRISARYGNLDILEDGYGINLLPLARFALETYENDPCECFRIHYREDEYDVREKGLDMKIHKAISVIQFKLEGQLIQENPEYEMDQRRLLHQMDLEKGVVVIEGKEYTLLDKYFPTIDPKDPYKLTDEESRVIRRLRRAFLRCEKLQRHIRFLYAKGSMYKKYNGNLLFHGCVPLNKDGSFRKVKIFGEEYCGKALYDVLDRYARKAYFSNDPEEKNKSANLLWYSWTNQNSPVFGKEKMTTFERYFVAEKATHKEPKNPYYYWYENEEVVNHIFTDFGLPMEDGHIINGHIPVESKKGESPIKCNGKLLVIDGGFSKAYQPTTGIAGYTLTYNSFGIVLAAHEPFESLEKAVKEESDIYSHKVLVEHVKKRKLVMDTDNGLIMSETIQDLKKLLQAYDNGLLSEKE